MSDFKSRTSLLQWTELLLMQVGDKQGQAQNKN